MSCQGQSSPQILLAQGGMHPQLIVLHTSSAGLAQQGLMKILYFCLLGFTCNKTVPKNKQHLCRRGGEIHFIPSEMPLGGQPDADGYPGTTSGTHRHSSAYTRSRKQILRGLWGAPMQGVLQPGAVTLHHQLCHCPTCRPRCGEDGETCWVLGSLPRAAEKFLLTYSENPSDLLALLSELPALSIFGLLSRKQELKILWRCVQSPHPS